MVSREIKIFNVSQREPTATKRNGITSWKECMSVNYQQKPKDTNKMPGKEKWLHKKIGTTTALWIIENKILS